MNSLVNLPRSGSTIARHTSRYMTPGQKTKDTCDSCAAAKVKCTKEKPACSRCQNLGYPCFYSPAKRIGRPHPGRRAVSQSQISSMQKEEDVVGVDKTRSLSRPVSALQLNNSSRVAETTVSGNTWFDLDSFAYSVGQQYHVDNDSTLTEINGSESRLDLKELADLETMSHGNRHSDCFITAVELLSSLHEADLRHRQACRDSSVTNNEGLYEKALCAVKPVMTILVCPCSSSTEVGLLCAAVCAAILDLFEIVLSPSSKQSEMTTHQANMEDQRAMTDPLSPAVLVDILGKFSSVANLTMMFCQKYGRGLDQTLHEAQPLPLLAAGLRQRITEMASRATTWLAEGRAG